jgi:hypothetical protein
MAVNYMLYPDKLSYMNRGCHGRDDKKVTCVYEKDIHISHKGQGAATNREKGQGVTRTRAGAAPCKNGLARTQVTFLSVDHVSNNSVSCLHCSAPYQFEYVKAKFRTLTNITYIARTLIMLYRVHLA